MNEDTCVDVCPIDGHSPLCSNKECEEQRKKDSWESCRALIKQEEFRNV